MNDYYDDLPRYSDNGRYDFHDLLAYALKAKLTPREEEFLEDIEDKYTLYGDDMFWSDLQSTWLQSLAVRGGFRPDDCGGAV